MNVAEAGAAPPTPSGPGAPDRHDGADGGARGAWFMIGRVLALAAFVGLIGFWVWALFFASKESVNKIGDRAWAERAEGICDTAGDARDQLIDLRRVDPEDPTMLTERAALVDQSTDIIETMLDDVVTVAPSDDKGAAIVPEWESEYRTYIGNRRDFAESLRAGRYDPFSEAAVNGVPISERLSTFAVDNEMKSCAPPNDLSL